MNYEEYREQGEEEYYSLSKVVREILENLIHDPVNELRCQPIQNRAKAPGSLRKKLEMRGLLDSDNIEDEVKDLAGCRLIFYTNTEVNKLLQSGLIGENFDIDWDKSKFHEPIDDQDSRYVATHYTVRLNAKTLAEEGKGRFAGMLCEIQVQTILNHAWAETTHDIIYKSPSLEGYGTTEFQSIERRLNKVMTDYLRPAGYEFQKAQLDFENLVTGKSIYESGSLDRLAACEDNNQRHELLERFRDYVLPNYDDIVSAFPEVRQQIVDAIRDARNTPAKPIETPYGSFPGKSEIDVSDVALDILERLRYLDVEQSFVTLCEIYSTSSSEKETDRLIKAAENLASHDLTIWQEHGPIVQRKIIDQIKLLEPDLVASVLPLVTGALSQVLNAEARSIKSNLNTFTIQHASVLPSADLKAIREETVVLLTELYGIVSDTDKRLVRNAVWSATRTASYPPENDELDVVVIENCQFLVNFFASRVSDENFEVLQGIEHRIYWLKKHFSPWAVADEAHPERSAAAASLLLSIEDFRQIANQNDEFRIYKVLVGYESIFPPAWGDESFDHRDESAYRKSELNNFVENISSENADAWVKRIELCAAVESRDLATFQYFGQFLKEMASAQPEILINLVTQRNAAGTKFLQSIYDGLQRSAPAEITAVLIGWCGDFFSLERICRAIRYADQLDNELLKAASKAALDSENRLAVLEVVATLFTRPDIAPDEAQLRLFRDCFHFISENKDTVWVHDIWFKSKDSNLLRAIDADDARLLLSNLVYIPEVEYHTEAILEELLELYPDLVVDFFGDRVRYSRELEDEFRYSAIPFEFYQIAEKLQPHFELILELGEKLFKEDDFLFEFSGGRLISITFPTFTPQFEEKLTQIVSSGDEEKIDFTLHVLRNYKGQAFLHKLCKEIANVLEADNKLLNSLSIVLDSTGVVTGEFGFRDAYIAKKLEMEKWLTDDRERVREFARREILSLERQIAAAQRRALEDIEMRRRDYEEESGGG